MHRLVCWADLGVCTRSEAVDQLQCVVQLPFVTALSWLSDRDDMEVMLVRGEHVWSGVATSEGFGISSNDIVGRVVEVRTSRVDELRC